VAQEIVQQIAQPYIMGGGVQQLLLCKKQHLEAKTV